MYPIFRYCVETLDQYQFPGIGEAIGTIAPARDGVSAPAGSMQSLGPSRALTRDRYDRTHATDLDGFKFFIAFLPPWPCFLPARRRSPRPTACASLP